MIPSHHGHIPSTRPEPVPGVRRVMHRAVTGARGAVPRYTRELIASVAERLGAQAPVEPSAQIEAFTQADLAALWIGHATVLLHVGGVGGITILTDPVFSRRIGMSVGGMTLGLARIAPPAIDIAHLPPIDLVLLSHAHFDHLDRPSLRRLVGAGTGPRHNEFKDPGPPAPARNAAVITAPHARRLIPQGYGEVPELPGGGWARVSGEAPRRRGGGGGAGGGGGDDPGTPPAPKHLTITAIKPEHWGARTAYDRHRRFNSYLIESNHHRILFAGDTAHTHAFDHLGPVDLAIFGIGAYNPWEHAHATPEQVWSMYTHLGAPAHDAPHGHLLPMHHSTFILSREPVAEPLERLRHIAGPHTGRIVAEMPGKMWAMLK